MDWESNTCYLKLCRLCLSEPGMCTIHEINNLSRDIFVCTGVELIFTDKLPKKICNNCHNIIKNTIDFRELASKNDLHLKSVCVDSEKEMVSDDLVSSTISNVDNKSKYFDQEEPDKQIETKQEINNPDNQIDVQAKFHTISIRKDLFPNSTQTLLDEKPDTKEGTKRRQKKIEAIEVLEYRCGVCCRNFETWKKLYLHSRLHNKNIKCPIEFCGKMFSTKGDLEKHVRTHTGEKPYECNVCQRKFTQKGTLKSHIETVHREDDQLTRM